MSYDFIALLKVGVGPILVRYSDIITLELTPLGFTRIEFGYGEHLIVEESPYQIKKIIENLENLKEQD